MPRENGMNIKKRGIGGKAGCCSPFSERAHVCGRATMSNGNRLDQLPDIFYPSFHYFITVSDFENLYFTLEVKKRTIRVLKKIFLLFFFLFSFSSERNRFRLLLEIEFYVIIYGIIWKRWEKKGGESNGRMGRKGK